MKHYFSMLCVVVLLAGCGAGSTLHVVSPSASDDEIRRRASEVAREKVPSALTEKPPASSASSELPVIQEPLRVVKPSDESGMRGLCTCEALSNLLERKGIISRSELLDEMKRLKEQSR